MGPVWEEGVAAYGEARQLKACLDQSGSTSQVRQAEHKDCAGMTLQTDDPDLCVPLTLQPPRSDMGMKWAALISTMNSGQVRFCSPPGLNSVSLR